MKIDNQLLPTSAIRPCWRTSPQQIRSKPTLTANLPARRIATRWAQIKMNCSKSSWKTKIAGIFGILFLSFYFLVHKGNNRITIWYHHGLWLPPTTKNIKFETYPDLILITDDWAKSNCSMPKSSFQELLDKLKWCNWCYGIGNHGPVPDSLKNVYPIEGEFKSNTGDFLILSAKEIDKEIVNVFLYTDWN